MLTAPGLRAAVVYNKLHNRMLRPLLAADQPQAPSELRQAFNTIDRHIERYAQQARIRLTA